VSARAAGTSQQVRVSSRGLERRRDFGWDGSGDFHSVRTGIAETGRAIRCFAGGMGRIQDSLARKLISAAGRICLFRYANIAVSALRRVREGRDTPLSLGGVSEIKRLAHPGCSVIIFPAAPEVYCGDSKD